MKKTLSLIFSLMLFAAVSLKAQPCPANIEVDNDPGICGAIVNYTTPPGTLTNGLASGAVFPVGTTLVEFTTPACSFTVTVTDTEAPTFFPTGEIVPVIPVTLSQLGRKTTYSNVKLNGGSNVITTKPGETLSLSLNWASSFDGGGGCVGCITQHHIGLGEIFSVCHHAGFGSGVISQSFNAPSSPGIYYINQRASWWYYCGQFGTLVHNNNPNYAIAVVVVEGIPDDISLSNDAGICGAVVNYFTPEAFDNCEALTVQTSGLPSGSVFPVGTTTNTFEANDAEGNSEIASFTVTVSDDEDPVISCPVPEAGYDTDAGECTAELSFEATVTDNCSATVEYFIGADPITFPYVFPFGITTVTAKATDPSSNTDECTFDVNVDNVVTITLVTVNPDEQQYSDLVTFTATVVPYECAGVGTAAQSVDFYVGSQLMGNAPVVLGVATLSDVALVEPGFTPDCFTDGELAPGAKTVTADFVGVDPNFTVVDPTTSLTITQEDISVWYTGTDIAATVSVGSSDFSVTLRAVVKDEADSDTGDVRNAKVRFLNGGVAGTPIITGDTDGDGWICVTLLDGSDLTEGLVETIWEGQINDNPDQFDIAVEVGGYYDGMSQEYPLIIYEPEGDFITGGGWQEIPVTVAGFYAADAGSKMNFGFNVKFNKKGTNLQGKMNIIYRAGGTVYQIKSNATTSLGTDLSNEGELKAEFVSKANLTDVTDPENPISISGNLTLHVTMTDKGEPGSGDMIAFTLYDGDPNALWFSNNWVFPNTEELVINGGNLVVHSGAGGDRGKGKSGIISIDDASPDANFNVYPNPFSEQAFIEFSAATDSRAKLDIFDVTGKKLSTLIDQNVNAGEEFRLEYQPGTIANGMLFYTLTIDNKVKTGKLIYRR